MLAQELISDFGKPRCRPLIAPGNDEGTIHYSTGVAIDAWQLGGSGSSGCITAGLVMAV
jgi:hypothetical protein